MFIALTGLHCSGKSYFSSNLPSSYNFSVYNKNKILDKLYDEYADKFIFLDSNSWYNYIYELNPYSATAMIINEIYLSDNIILNAVHSNLEWEIIKQKILELEVKKMKVKKAGCILINKENGKIGLIYRQKQKDYSFPKGHAEKGESMIECAIRETAEETKRDCKLVSLEPVAQEHYFDSKKDEVDMYYYIALDMGKSDNSSTDTHDLIWTSYEEVYETLSYESLKKIWNEVKEEVYEILNNDK